MAAKVGSLTVDIGANIARLQKDMGKARKEITDFRRHSEDQFNRLKNTATAAIAVIGGAALVNKIIDVGRESLQTADAIAKAADNIGIASDYLQELEFAFSQTGVAEEEGRKALEQWNKRVAEAYQGTGKLKDILSQYGISLTDNQGRLKSSQMLMGEFADKFKDIQSPMERTRVIMEAFGRSGAPMINLLRLGSGGIDELRKKARDAGMVIEEDFLRASERANDALDTMHRVIRASVVRAVADLSDEIVDLAQAVIDGRDEISAMASDLFTIGKAAIVATAYVARFITMLGKGLGIAAARASGAGSDTVAGRQEDTIKAIEKRNERIQKTLEQIRQGNNYTLVDTKALTDELEMNNRQLKNLRDTAKDFDETDYLPDGNKSKKLKEQIANDIKNLGELSLTQDFETAEKRLKIQQELQDKIKKLTMNRFDYEKDKLKDSITAMRAEVGDLPEFQKFYDAQMKAIEAAEAKAKKSGKGGGGKSKESAEAEKEMKDAIKRVEERLRFQSDLSDQLKSMEIDLINEKIQINRDGDAELRSLISNRVQFERALLDKQVEAWEKQYGKMAEIAAYQQARTEEINRRAFESFVNNSDSALAGAHRAFKEYSDRYDNIANNVAEGFRGTFQTLQQVVQDFASGAEVSFEKLFQALLAQAAQFSTQTFIFGPLSTWLQGFTGQSLLQSFLSGGGGGGSITAAAAGVVPKFATGGYVDRTTLAVVGEVPEVIIPVSKLSKAQQGDRERPLQVNFNVRTPDLRGFRETESQIFGRLSVGLRNVRGKGI